MKSEFYVYDPSVLYQAHKLEMEHVLREGLLVRRASPARPGFFERVKAFFRRQYDPSFTVSAHSR